MVVDVRRRAALVFNRHFNIELRHSVFLALVEHPCVGVEESGILWLRLNGFRAHSLRLVEVAVAEREEVGVIVQNAHIVGVNFYGLVVERKSPDGVAHREFGIAHATQKHRAVLRVGAVHRRKSLFIHLYGFVVLLDVVVCWGDVAVKFNVVGIQLYGTVAGCDGCFVVF